MGRFKEYKESFLEVLWITKSCLTTFWYWLPIGIMVYMMIQLWLMFFVHPLTLAILPAVLMGYGIWLEEKRTSLRYGLGKIKRIRASHGLGANPEPVGGDKWKVEEAVDQYKRLLKLKESEANEE